MAADRSDDERYRLELNQAGPSIAKLLTSIPETWSDFKLDDLTDVETKTLYWLIAAGMIERRLNVRVRHVGQSNSFEATITATGEYGFVEAMKPLCSEVWTEWQAAHEEWVKSAAPGESGLICESTPIEQWRLTDQGCIARGDIRSGDASAVQTVFDFVLKRGFFAHRPLVRGVGRSLSVRRCDGQSDSKGFHILNWPEGAAAFANSFAEQKNGVDDPLLTHVELAKRYGCDAEAARKKLDRWRGNNKGGGWMEVTDRRSNEPGYLYRVSAVESLFKRS